MSKKTNPIKQPVAKTKVLELRQADDLSNAVNGDFQTSFEPFSLVEGDSVVLKSCILDTTQSSLTKVVVDKDLTLTINALPYVKNYQFDDKSYLTGIGADGTPTDITRQPDHDRYFASQLSQSGSHRIIESVTFKAVSPDQKILFFTFSIIYKDINGSLQQTNKVYHCPETKVRGHHDGRRAVTVPINIQLPIYDDSSVPTVPELVSQGGSGGGINATFKISPTLLHGGFLMPIELSHNIDLKAGSYDPQSLCKVINDSVNSNTSGERALEAPFLQDSAHYDERSFTLNITSGSPDVVDIASTNNYPLPVGTKISGTGIPDDTHIITIDNTAKTATLSNPATATTVGLSVTANNTVYMVKEDNTKDADAFNFHNPTKNPNNHSSLFGSSQVQLDIDVTNKFQFKYLHTPYYDPTTGNQSLFFNYVSGIGKMFKLGLVGGIAISALTAKVKATNEVSLFWSSQLGFSDGTVEGIPSQCNAQVGSWAKKPNIGSLSNVMFPVYSNLATATTSQFIGSDDAVQKLGAKNTSSANPPVITYSDQQFYALSSTTSFKATADPDSTNAVIAATPYTELVGNATGYFKIDIQGLAPTELVSSSGTTRSVQAVVTRYYNDGNFTSGSQDSGIVYQHVGEPKMISNLRTRILDPDNSLAIGLGADNTIFLEILKV